MDILEKVAQTLVQVRAKKPLVHHLTNFVTVNDCANITLAFGASPVMANDPGEVEDMVAHAAALVINIGAINAQLVDGIIAAGKKANALEIPVVFDPVGAGATRMRATIAERIINEVQVSVVRGNMSEVTTLAGFKTTSKGVDSTADETGSEQIARLLAQKLDTVVAITGKIDVVATTHNVCHIHNGHALLASVTGTGCMATSLVGSCTGATGNNYIGAITGIMAMGIAGEIAQQSLTPTEGTGTFRMRIFDAISNMSPDTIRRHGNIS